MAFLKNIGLDSFHERKKSEAVEDNRAIKNNSNLKIVDYWHFSKNLKSKPKNVVNHQAYSLRLWLKENRKPQK